MCNVDSNEEFNDKLRSHIYMYVTEGRCRNTVISLNNTECRKTKQASVVRRKKPVKMSYGKRKTSGGRGPGDENWTKFYKQQNRDLYFEIGVMNFHG